MLTKYFSLSLLICFSLALNGQQVNTVVTNSGIDDALIIDEAGHLFGVRYQGSAISRWVPFETSTTVFSDGFNTPNGMAFGPDGILYMADNEGNKIYKIDTEGNATIFVDDFNNPSGLIFELDSDTLIATSYTGNRIAKIAPNGEWFPWVTGDQLNGPVGLCYDDDGRLYTGNFNNRKIIRLGDNGEQTLIGQAPGGTNQWLGFIAYAHGYIYGTLFTQHQIYRMDLDGNGTVILGSTAGTVDGDASMAKFNGPNGIVATPSQDTLFVSEYNTRALRMITGLEDGTTGAQTALATSVHWSLSPNPATDTSELRFELQQRSHVSIQVFDQQGQLMLQVLDQQNLLAGTHQVSIPTAKLPKGSYVIKLSLDGGRPVSTGLVKQ
ncbi:T9SS type A sorting domain-containing protein [Lewinella sp. LCG006]|uniref:T9SS type A sorting domain-containing protein n=1 Tax=Lewinella sp. LCG006 TaxID=3231911 RepID=UPI0034609B52